MKIPCQLNSVVLIVHSLIHLYLEVRRKLFFFYCANRRIIGELSHLVDGRMIPHVIIIFVVVATQVLRVNISRELGMATLSLNNKESPRNISMRSSTYSRIWSLRYKPEKSLIKSEKITTNWHRFRRISDTKTGFHLLEVKTIADNGGKSHDYRNYSCLSKCSGWRIPPTEVSPLSGIKGPSQSSRPSSLNWLEKKQYQVAATN